MNQTENNLAKSFHMINLHPVVVQPSFEKNHCRSVKVCYYGAMELERLELPR
jgi:hypothetical protein